MAWAEEEFGGAVLGDAGLTKRLVRLADDLSSNPTKSIPVPGLNHPHDLEARLVAYGQREVIALIGDISERKLQEEQIRLLAF